MRKNTLSKIIGSIKQDFHPAQVAFILAKATKDTAAAAIDSEIKASAPILSDDCTDAEFDAYDAFCEEVMSRYNWNKISASYAKAEKNLVEEMTRELLNRNPNSAEVVTHISSAYMRGSINPKMTNQLIDICMAYNPNL